MKSTGITILNAGAVLLLSLLISLCAGSGFSARGAARAQDVSAAVTEADEMLREMPENMPKDYSDDEINRMLEDVQQIDDSQDLEGKDEINAPPVTDEDRALIEDIRQNPEKYAEYIKDREWLDAHPVVIWSVCSDYVWIDAHPQFAARIYLEYDFWSRYPYVAFVLASNRPYLVRYPRITLAFYGYDSWFILHPFIAREVYRNYVVFNRYPDLFQRYYRHRDWLHRHPGVTKIAYGNRELFKSHVRYLGNIYKFRREALKQREIHPRHVEKMYSHWKSDPRRTNTFRPSGPNREWKQRPEGQRKKNLNRGQGGKSDKLIKRGEQYRPDRDNRRDDGRTIKTDNRGASRNKSEKLIQRGKEYKPDREYKRGMNPGGDKSIIRGRDGGRGQGKRESAPGERGNQQGGERGRGGR